MKFRKVLWIVLIAIAVCAIVTGIYFAIQNKKQDKEQSSLRNINVQTLAAGDEQKIGTIIYAGAKIDGKLASDSKTQTVNLTTTDSLEGATNIYYQDVLNRYKNYNVTKRAVTKSDAINKTSNVITVTGQSGKITITVWGDNKGITHIQIVTSSDFK